MAAIRCVSVQSAARSAAKWHRAPRWAAAAARHTVAVREQTIPCGRGRGRVIDRAAPARAVPEALATAATFLTQFPWLLPVLCLAIIAMVAAKQFQQGSRKYAGNVGQEYDAWTREGILEHYWGEHIHLGYYNEQDRQKGFFAWGKKDFKQAKYDFVDEMLKWGNPPAAPQRILDVGCGFGGTSRMLAQKYPDGQVEGITISPEQVKRGTQLAQERGISNVQFHNMDALAMNFKDNTFDIVWACESGEHMPDKKKYIEEMVRVLKPGGSLIIACWCQREEGDQPFTDQEQADLQFLYDEWAHPFFISKEEFVRIMEGTGQLERCEAEDWCEPTIATWRHSIWVGVESPWYVLMKLNAFIWWKVVREIVCLERMHSAFDRGLMEYGMMRAVKAAPTRSTIIGSQMATA